MSDNHSIIEERNEGKLSRSVLKPSGRSDSLAQGNAKCGYIHPDNRQTQAKFVCQSCGHSENADLNAAQVLRKRGVKTILSTASDDWEIQSDHTIKLAVGTRGTRESARRGNIKTMVAVASVAIPESRIISELSANL